MKASKILFPTDFSTASDAGLEYAAALAKESGAMLLVLHVQEPPVAYGVGELYYGIPEPNTDAVRAMLDRVTPRDETVPCVHRLVNGDPAGTIIDVAEDEAADLIVMGTHGRTGLARLLMGSVAEAVVRRAKCPVLTLKQPPRAREKPKARQAVPAKQGG